jgi:riboflavin biosynthesis pyrimidine reductase
VLITPGPTPPRSSPSPKTPTPPTWKTRPTSSGFFAPIEASTIPALLAGLYARDVRAVFLEGGPTLVGSFVGQGLVDRIINYVAPALLGAGKPGLGDAGITTMADIRRLDVLHLSRSGPDVRVVARPVR